jgi:hypothetical protein
MSQEESSQGRRALSKEETDALNRHGVFFKKRVLKELSEIPGIGIVDEEVGVTFGGTRVVDIVAANQTAKPHVFFIIECKRVQAKTWLFFRAWDQRCRISRVSDNMTGHASRFCAAGQWPFPVASEGFEYWVPDKKEKEPRCDQDPIFQAAAQLCAGYCGFIARRQREFPNASTQLTVCERYVPMLVTNAELVVVEDGFQQVNLESGTAPGVVPGACVPELVLKHPFPTPAAVEQDFRDSQNPPPTPVHWSQLHKESVYVVRATQLREFFRDDSLERFRTA